MELFFVVETRSFQSTDVDGELHGSLEKEIRSCHLSQEEAESAVQTTYKSLQKHWTEDGSKFSEAMTYKVMSQRELNRLLPGESY